MFQKKKSFIFCYAEVRKKNILYEAINFKKTKYKNISFKFIN